MCAFIKSIYIQGFPKETPVSLKSKISPIYSVVIMKENNVGSGMSRCLSLKISTFNILEIGHFYGKPCTYITISIPVSCQLPSS